jgi:hypothetical protein
LICSEILDEDWTQCIFVVVGLMKAKPVMREICYTTNMIPAKDIKMNDD